MTFWSLQRFAVIPKTQRHWHVFKLIYQCPAALKLRSIFNWTARLKQVFCVLTGNQSWAISNIIKGFEILCHVCPSKNHQNQKTDYNRIISGHIPHIIWMFLHYSHWVKLPGWVVKPCSPGSSPVVETVTEFHTQRRDNPYFWLRSCGSYPDCE